MVHVLQEGEFQLVNILFHHNEGPSRFLVILCMNLSGLCI